MFKRKMLSNYICFVLCGYGHSSALQHYTMLQKWTNYRMDIAHSKHNSKYARARFFNELFGRLPATIT